MLRRAVVKFLGALTVLAGVGLSQEAAAAEHTLKIGTLAPRSSPWGQVFTVWEKAVKEKSGGRLELQFFYNGQQGDEGAMVGKIKAGQLHGSAITAVGLSKIYKPILALQMPGLFKSWAKLDSARNAMKGEFEKGCFRRGLHARRLGRCRRGAPHVKGLRGPDARRYEGQEALYVARRRHPAVALPGRSGAISPVPLNVPEVLPQLNTGAVNIVVAPALAAEQLQWASKLDHIVSNTSGFAIGALVMSTKSLDALPADLRQIVTDTGKVAAAALTTRIRNEDAAAFTRMKGKMTVVTLTGEEEAKWDSLFKQVRARLAQGTFSPELVSKLEGLAQ
jgi:TRAP-type C4-dicarboxylate transport system substrate-binding protein